MFTFPRVAVTGAGLVAITIAAAGSALAAAPPWQSPATDPNNVGTLAFYDSTGLQITSGSTLSPIPYAEATGLTPKTGNNFAALYAYTPKIGTNPGAWSGAILSGATQFPNAAAPAPLTTDTKPVVTETGSDGTLDDFSTNGYPNTDTTDAGYVGVYELRVKTSGTGGSDAHYASADVTINAATHVWTQLYPAVTAAATTTSLAVTPTSTSSAATSVTLTATSSAPGVITFKNGATTLGAPQNTTGAGNTATLTTTAGAIGAGAHLLTATLAPAQTALFAPSSSTAQTFTYTAPAQSTTTVVTVSPGSGNAYSAQTLTATVTTAGGAVPVGAVQFSDSVQHALGTAAVNGSGVATFVASNLSGGSHTITAAFTPTDAGAFVASSASATPFSLTAVGATDDQTLSFTIAPGSLVLTSPYTSSNPLNLGTATLSTDGTKFVTKGNFGSVTNPAQGLTLTDSRAGNPGWTVSALVSSAFTDAGGDTVASSGLSLTGVTAGQVTGNALQVSDVTTHDISAFSSSAQPIANVGLGKGDGSVYLYGVFNVAVPSSSATGTYTGVATFTAL